MDKQDFDTIRAIMNDALAAGEVRLDAKFDASFERHLAAVHDDISDLRSDTAAGLAAAAEEHAVLGAKLDQFGHRLSSFQDHEIDKRHALEVRIGRVEQHVGLADRG